MAVYKRCAVCQGPIEPAGKGWRHRALINPDHVATPPEEHTFAPEQGRDVTAEDHAELSRRRKAQAIADMEVLGPIEHHTNSRVQCQWCGGKVFRYGSTPSGERHYCRSCCSAILAAARGRKCAAQQGHDRCVLDAGHPGKHRSGDYGTGVRRAWADIPTTATTTPKGNTA